MKKVQMKFSGKRIIRGIITAVLLVLAIYANLYAIRMMTRYGVEAYLYDKLLVAYREGAGMPALTDELERAISRQDMPLQAALAREFKKNLSTHKDPEGFLEDRVTRDTRKIQQLRTLRTASILLIVLIFLLRLALDFSGRPRRNAR